MLGPHVLLGEGGHSGLGPAASCEALLFSITFLLEIFMLKQDCCSLQISHRSSVWLTFFNFSLASQAFSDFLPFFLPANISKT